MFIFFQSNWITLNFINRIVKLKLSFQWGMIIWGEGTSSVEIWKLFMRIKATPYMTSEKVPEIVKKCSECTKKRPISLIFNTNSIKFRLNTIQLNCYWIIYNWTRHRTPRIFKSFHVRQKWSFFHSFVWNFIWTMK